LLWATNGEAFETIYVESNVGNSPTIMTYNHLDYFFTSPSAYYRIVQYDLDGESSSTPIEMVSLGEISHTETRIVSRCSQIELNGFNSPLPGKLSIIDMGGRVVYNQDLSNATDKTLIDLPTLPTGIYTASISYGGQIQHIKFALNN
jgi:hypothetical protein